ncbi:hypothetical protein [Tsukamurella paurometabola]|uniref:hypothetical protein n=1 Tax=Tsukamurella paurometabola TaxID=2061 RepID=UPI00135B09FF|nr:hypothetical protein [Tsukamurella paurometabola]
MNTRLRDGAKIGGAVLLLVLALLANGLATNAIFGSPKDGDRTLAAWSYPQPLWPVPG